MKSISRETQAAVRLVARRDFEDGTSSGNAVSSGFFWRHLEEIYIVTCWHCLSGLHPDTKLPIGSFCPNRVRVSGRFRRRIEGVPQEVSAGFDYDIETEDSEGNYLWIEHPTQNNTDVCAIALPLSEDENNKVICLNDLDFEQRFKPKPAADAFIVGYPEGLSGQSDTPIFKRATIASEPELQFNGQNVLLVDCIGNQGLSGAPVILTGSGMLPNEEIPGNSLIGSWQNFLGVYSGRLSDNGIGSQLGRVWKSDCVAELFEHSAPDLRGA